MDLISFLAMFYDFLVLLIPLSIIAFIGSKLLSKLRVKIEERFNLDWLKSIFITNFVIIFVAIFLIYIYFILIGVVTAEFRTVELEYNIFENLILLGMGGIRILITTLILSLFLLFFEFVFSIVVDLLEEKEWSITVKEFIAVLVTALIFLILFLFLFSWAAFGLFIYVFYGGVSSGPLLMVL
jgi:hypothetical protein